jgi:hypothetical protein
MGARAASPTLVVRAFGAKRATVLPDLQRCHRVMLPYATACRLGTLRLSVSVSLRTRPPGVAPGGRVKSKCKGAASSRIGR